MSYLILLFLQIVFGLAFVFILNDLDKKERLSVAFQKVFGNDLLVPFVLVGIFFVWLLISMLDKEHPRKPKKQSEKPKKANDKNILLISEKSEVE